jgi:molecular chaperone GrpE
MTTEKKKGTKPLHEADEATKDTAPLRHAGKTGADEMVTLPLKDYAAQLKEIDDLKEQAQTSLDGWQRERADFINYRNRVEREQSQKKQDLAVEVIKKYLAVSDDINRALKSRPTEGDAAHWAEGIELIRRKLANILDCEGMTTIDAEGKQFDPNFHEAISHEESDSHESGEIIEVVQQGYMLGDRVIRPALVRVAK